MITTMPSDSHLARRVSISIMLVDFKYKTGVKLSPAAIWAAATGDCFCWPAANQDSSSAIQKSGSSCVAMAWRSVIIILLSMRIILWPWARNSSAILGAVSVAGVGASISKSVNFGVAVIGAAGESGLLSNVMSENTGASENSVNSGSMSKSDGNGMSFADCITGTGSAAGVGGVVMFVALKRDVWAGPICWRARINAGLISLGMFDGKECGGASSDGVADGVVDVGVADGVGAVAGVLLFSDSRKNHGVGIVISGFLVLMIMLVVAMYMGNAARIKMPNTNPANPVNCACARRIQFARMNMSKLNR